MNKKIKTMELYGFKNVICNLEAIGLSNCLMAYAENNCDDIMMIGFNENSGYVYIALENGVQICSRLGNKVEYLVTDFETGEEKFFDKYQDALKNAVSFLDS